MEKVAAYQPGKEALLEAELTGNLILIFDP
jgi:hypothetical protein